MSFYKRGSNSSGGGSVVTGLSTSLGPDGVTLTLTQGSGTLPPDSPKMFNLFTTENIAITGTMDASDPEKYEINRRDSFVIETRGSTSLSISFSAELDFDFIRIIADTADSTTTTLTLAGASDNFIRRGAVVQGDIVLTPSETVRITKGENLNEFYVVDD